MPLIILILVFAIEISLFIAIGGEIGIIATLFWIVAGVFIGGMMIARGGEESRKWLNNVRSGQKVSGAPKLYWFIGGILVMMPGFFTDAMGFSLMIPFFRHFWRWLLEWFIPIPDISGFEAPRQTSMRADVIEGEIIEPDEDKQN